MITVEGDPKTSEWGKIVFGEKKNKFSYNFSTREVFNMDPDLLMRAKCIPLTFLTPLMSVARSVGWLAKTVFEGLSELYFTLDGQEYTSHYKLTAYESLRALGYGVVQTAYAASGILYPQWARQNYGRLERELNRHSDGPHRNKYYLALCFQRLYVVPKDTLIENDRKLAIRLEKFLDKAERIRAAFLSCHIRQLMVEFMPKQVPTNARSSP